MVATNVKRRGSPVSRHDQLKDRFGKPGLGGILDPWSEGLNPERSNLYLCPRTTNWKSPVPLRLTRGGGTPKSRVSNLLLPSLPSPPSVTRDDPSPSLHRYFYLYTFSFETKGFCIRRKHYRLSRDESFGVETFGWWVELELGLGSECKLEN